MLVSEGDLCHHKRSMILQPVCVVSAGRGQKYHFCSKANLSGSLGLVHLHHHCTKTRHDVSSQVMSGLCSADRGPTRPSVLTFRIKEHSRFSGSSAFPKFIYFLKTWAGSNQRLNGSFDPDSVLLFFLHLFQQYYFIYLYIARLKPVCYDF